MATAKIGKGKAVEVTATATRALKVKLAVLKARTVQVFSAEPLAKRALRRTQERFMREEDPEGQKWARLSPLTRKRVNEMGGNKVLVDSLALYNSIDYRLDTLALKKGTVGASGGGFRIVAGGSKAPYAPYHQFGEGRVPQRRFIGLTDKDTRSLIDMIRNILKGRNVRP